MSKRAFAFLAGVLAGASAVFAQDARPGQVREAIETRVGKVLDLQQQDGSFVLDGVQGVPATNPVGQTALAVVALQHARSHVKGALLERTDEAIRKGIAFIASRPVEMCPDSAGLVLCAVVQSDPGKYEKLIKAYAAALVLGQSDRGYSVGQWGYHLPGPSTRLSTRERREGIVGDHRGTFFALLGLRQAQRAGLSVPEKVWERTAKYYAATQSRDGGWPETWRKDVRTESEFSPTVVGLTNFAICREMLTTGRKDGAAPPPSPEVERGMQWVLDHWDKGIAVAEPHVFATLYCLDASRGLRGPDGRDLYHEVVLTILDRSMIWGEAGLGRDTTVCYHLVFLSRGVRPVDVGREDEPGTRPTPISAERLHAARLAAVRTTVAEMVVKILKMQEKNGAFVLDYGGGGGSGPFPLGHTALAVLALQYARPYLEGELLDQASKAIRRGVAVITQNPPEAMTYSAGLILAVLFNDGPSKHRELIGMYATMLVMSQRPESGGPNAVPGMWGYELSVPGGAQRGPKLSHERWADNSNTQFAILGLYYANRAGFQVPRVIWQRSRRHYIRTQSREGGWGYKVDERAEPYANMTMAGTVSLFICEEMLLPEEQEQCAPPRGLDAVDRGLKWLVGNWQGIGRDTYGLYALERLALIMGRSNIGPHDWYEKGAASLVVDREWASYFRNSGGVPTCFGVIFLARGLDPIVINKLERRGTEDWNNTPYDVKHLVEHLQDHHQQRVQWRIVTPEAPLELLLRTPILHISGHDALDFNDAEKAKLKAYVAGGGTILAQACCSRKPFDESFRALVKELFGGELQTLPKTHRIYERMQLQEETLKPKIEVMRLDSQRGRPAILYLPNGIARQWHLGGERARDFLAVGTALYLYVTVDCQKMSERDGGERPMP
ncbi:MAG TPA: DUF4159 domain-containing protein [Planctomycetota bacterium]|nr:DUF4159 domain-containing protein [Planctomycetota bacterium]